MVKLEWTENRPPTEGACRYDHCIAETPFGRFLLTWKSWKTDWAGGLGFDETPWDGVEYHGWTSIDEAKKWAADEMEKRIKLLLVDQPLPPPVLTVKPPLTPLPLLELLDSVNKKFMIGQDHNGHEIAMIPPSVWRSVVNNVRELARPTYTRSIPLSSNCTIHSTHAICDECETVAHCTANGCIPKQAPMITKATIEDALVLAEIYTRALDASTRRTTQTLTQPF